MALEWNPDTYVTGLWFIDARRHDFDWLASVYKHPGKPWEGHFRFRYHRDSKVFDSADEKSWTSVQGRDDAAETGQHITRTFDEMARTLARACGGELTHVEINGLWHSKQRELERLPFFHGRLERPAQGKA